jgi:hypothetical protein
LSISPSLPSLPHSLWPLPDTGVPQSVPPSLTLVHAWHFCWMMHLCGSCRLTATACTAASKELPRCQTSNHRGVPDVDTAGACTIASARTNPPTPTSHRTPTRPHQKLSKPTPLTRTRPTAGCRVMSSLQELEVVLGDEHISFTTTKIGSLVDVEKSKDPEGLRCFYYLVQDLKCFVISIMALHFKIKPTPT